jgi:hypothetical protein
MVNKEARSAVSLASSLLPLIIVCAVSLGTALGLYRSYRFLFPFKTGAVGICMYCGASTDFSPGGWAEFCARHGPLALIPPVIVVAETISLFGACASFWLILRAFFLRGVRHAFLWIVFICATAMVGAMLVGHGSVRLWWHFCMGVVLLFFVLSAAYVDSLESAIVVITSALFIAASLALLIQVASWLLTGYFEIFI